MTAPRILSAARTFVATFGAAALLAACSVLPKAEPVQVWQPVEGAEPAAATPAPDFSLRVTTPNASGLVEQSGIVVMPKPGEVSTYKGARWSEPPSQLVEHRLVDAFMAAKLPAVTTADDHFAADYTLGGNLRAFQAEYRDGSPVTVVRLDAQLRRGFSHRLLAMHSFVVTQAPTGTQVPEIVAAFGKADDTLARKVVAWTIKVAERDQAAHPANERGARRVRTR